MDDSKRSVVSSIGYTFIYIYIYMLTTGHQMDLRTACEWGNVVRVRQLIQDGQDVNSTIHDRLGTTTPLICAAEQGYVDVVHELIGAGADVNAKGNITQTALHWASYNGHSSVVTSLIAAGANLNEQDVDGMTPLMVAAGRGHAQVELELIRGGADVNAKDNSKRTALHMASWWDHSSVVTMLIQAGANVNDQDMLGMTPLMVAAEQGRKQVVLELIRASADVSIISSIMWSSVAAGSTALHFAAKWNNIECGVLLIHAGADMKTSNKDSKSPLDLASHNFRQAVQQGQSFSTKRIVAVIGNGKHGKSTLITALQAEGNSLLKKFTNRFTKVQDIRHRTAGIEAVQFSSHKYGETLFYDFAGQSAYHGPHQTFLEAMLSKPGMSASLLLLVRATDEVKIIMQQVVHWLQPLSLGSAPSTLHVLIVGSFLDQVKSKEEATEKLLRCTQLVQEEFNFNIQGPCLLDCRTPESEGINQICTFLQEVQPLQLNSISFSYSLHWILVEIRRSFSIPCITLNDFHLWLQNDAKLLLRNFPSPEQICHDLTAVGHTLFLPNKQVPSQSWLVLDLQAILHDVYGTLFSGSQGMVNQFGLLHCSHLAKLFPDLDPTMIQEVLISLEFCIKVDSSQMRKELLKLIATDKGERWLYFPALVSAQPPDIFSEDPDPQHLQWVCWQLRTVEENLISALLLQTIILRLAANHVFTHELSVGVREHCCSVWVNGISWRSTKGVDIAVQISDSSVVQVVGRSKAGPGKLQKYISIIVRDVIKTTSQLSPKLEATSYIVHPYLSTMWEDSKAPPLDFLYPISSIISSINEGDDHVLSLPKQTGLLPHQTSLTELFGGWCPSPSVIQAMDFKGEPLRCEIDSSRY